MTNKLTVRQAAEVLGYHPDHVRRLLRAGIIKAEKAGGLVWLIDRAEIERITREQENGRLYLDR
ncbi:MAG: helix-turn-helix domain-containing protein [Chloroflexota bacterium]